MNAATSAGTSRGVFALVLVAELAQQTRELEAGGGEFFYGCMWCDCHAIPSTT